MSLVNLIKPGFDNKKLEKVSPKHLATILTAFGIFLFASLFYPIKMVFSGDPKWILNQNLFVINVEEIKLLFWSIPMNSITIRTYSALIFIGAVLGFFLAIYLAKKHYIVTSLIDRIFVGLIIFGLIGARIFYVIFNLDKFEENLWDALLIYNGGLSIFGAVIGGGVYLWSYCKKYKFNFFEIADVIAPALLVGQIIGRFGNFFNYEAYGGPTSVFWKMYVPDAAIYSNQYLYDSDLAHYFHPTFLYEIIPNFILLILILWFYKKLTYKKSGMVLGLYMAGYGLIRFFTEFFRLDAIKIELANSLKFTTPSFIMDRIEGFLTNNDGETKAEYLLESLDGFEINVIKVSQLVAFLVFILGLFILHKRSKVIYLKKRLQEFDVS